MTGRIKRIIWWAFAAGAMTLLVIQFIPYGRAHANPPVIAEPPWDSPQTRELAMRACADCHSNQTTWPWYANVAPVSWLVQQHVDEGRATLNFSEWNRQQREAREASEEVREGEMPPSYYTTLHPSARLSQAEIDALIRGLEATFGQRRASTNSGAADSAPGSTR